MKKIKVVLVDDDVKNYDIIQDILNGEEDIEFVGFSPEEASFKELVKKTEPDIALLDIQLFSQRGGIDLLEWLKLEYPYVKSIMITASLDKVSECYRLGAEGYILKGDWHTVIPSIINVFQGDTVVPNNIAKTLVTQLKEDHHRDELFEDLKIFTQREVEILSYIKKGLPSNIIVQKLKVSPYTYKRHLQNIRKKSGERNLSHLLEKFHEIL